MKMTFTLTLVALVVIPWRWLAVMVPIATVAIVETTAIIVWTAIHPAIVVVAIIVAPTLAAVVSVVAWTEATVAHFATTTAATATVIHAVHLILGQCFFHIQLLVFDCVRFAHCI